MGFQTDNLEVIFHNGDMTPEIAILLNFKAGTQVYNVDTKQVKHWDGTHFVTGWFGGTGSGGGDPIIWASSIDDVAHHAVDAPLLKLEIGKVDTTITNHKDDSTVHLGTFQNAALDGSVNPLTASNPVADKKYVNDSDTALGTIITNHKNDSTVHLSQNQYDAMTIANSPSISNAFATMLDMPAPAPVPDPERLTLLGDNPAVELVQEAGGSSAAFQIVNGATSHLVSNIGWSETNEVLFFSLFDKTNGTLRNELIIKHNGNVEIPGAVNHFPQEDGDIIVKKYFDTALTSIEANKQSLRDKADKSSLPTIYSGDAVPLNSLGKDYDKFHQYTVGSTITTDLYTSSVRENYTQYGFYLAAESHGDTPQNGIFRIEIYPSERHIYIDLEIGETLSSEELKLFIQNPAGGATQEIVLNKISNISGAYIGYYESSDDTIIEAITTSSSFILQAKVGQTNAQEIDYEKRHGVWNGYGFFNVVQKSANYILTGDEDVVEATANSFTFTLPTAIGISGKRYIIKNSGTGVITVDGDSSETIDGELTQTLNQYDSITIVSNNTNWIII